MKDTQTILGIDVGSVSVSLAAIDDTGKPVFQESIYHHGEVKKTLADMLEGKPLSSVIHVAKTTSTPSFINAESIIDDQVAIIRSVLANTAQRVAISGRFF